MTVWFLALIAAFAGSVAAQGDKQYLPVAAGTQFQRNVKYFSESGNHYLIFQTDGNLVVYDKNNRFIWGVNTVSDKFGQVFSVQFRENGDFGLYDKFGSNVWSPPVKSGTAAFLTIRENGSLQLIASNGQILWSTDDKNASTVKLPAGSTALDLKTNLAGTWSGSSGGNQKFVISQDRITMLENGQIKWSGKYAITGKDTIAITYDNGQKVNADMIVSERQQGPKLVKRLRWDINNEMGGSYQWESGDTQVKDSNISQKTPAKPANTPSNETKKPKEFKDKIIGTWVIGPQTRYLSGTIPGNVVIIDRNGRYLTYDKEGKLVAHNYYWITGNNRIEIIQENFLSKSPRNVEFGSAETTMAWVMPTDELYNGVVVFELQSRDTDVKLGNSLGEKIIGFWDGVPGTNSENEKLNVSYGVWLTYDTTFNGSDRFKKNKFSVLDNETVLLNKTEFQYHNQSDIKLKVSIAGDTMTVTDDKGVQKKYNHVKSMDAASKFVF